MPRTTSPHFIETVRELVEALGGLAAVAGEFNLTPQAIHNWIAQGEVPRRYWSDMLQLTLREGLQWRPPGWDPQVELRYRRIPRLDPAA